MSEELSILRLLGIITGLGLLSYTFFRLRDYTSERGWDFLIGMAGIALVIISLYPSVINYPSDLLNLQDIRGGRLITLLIIISAIMWVLLISLKKDFSNISEQFDSLIRQHTIDEARSQISGVGHEPVAVIIPAYNESSNLKDVLPRIPRDILGHPVMVIIIDDASTDDTYEVSKSLGATVLRHRHNRGGGAALRAGYDFASEINSSVVVTMDADGQHLPEEIEILVKPIFEEGADIVIGSRLLGEYEKDSLVRHIGVHFFNNVISFILGIKVTDCSSGFRAFRLSKLTQLRLIQNQFHTAELIIDAAKNGLVITERPITILRRLHGQSKKGKNISYGYNFLKTILKTWFR